MQINPCKAFKSCYNDYTHKQREYKKMTKIEMRLNGYIYTQAAILRESAGDVNLQSLTELTASYIAYMRKAGATVEEVNRSWVRTCDMFNVQGYGNKG